MVDNVVKGPWRNRLLEFERFLLEDENMPEDPSEALERYRELIETTDRAGAFLLGAFWQLQVIRRQHARLQADGDGPQAD